MTDTTSKRSTRTAARASAPTRQVSAGVRVKRGAATTAFHGIAIALAGIFLAPLLLALMNSFKSPEEANRQPPTFLPESFSLGNYEKLATFGEGIGVYLWNSVSLSVISVAGTVLITVLAGYGFARFSFPGKNLLFVSTLAILMVPYATILLPLYLVMGSLGLQNSIFGLALVLIMFQLPFSIFLMRNAFESIPRELEEAALVDGAGPVKALRYISLPLVAPAVATVALFAFIASWNEFLAPLIFLNAGDQYTLPIMLVNIRSNAYGVVDYGAMQAGIVIAIVPTLIVYLLLQRYYVAGLTNGALRG